MGLLRFARNDGVVAMTNFREFEWDCFASLAMTEVFAMTELWNFGRNWGILDGILDEILNGIASLRSQ